MCKFIHVLLLSSAIIFSTNAQSAFLDTTFGNNGFAIDSSGSGNFLVGRSKMLVQPDQKILVRYFQKSNSNGQAGEIFLTRFLKDGTPDLAFGDNGSVVINNNQSFVGGLGQLILLADGKIITSFATFSNNTLQSVILKFNQNGQPEPTFGTNGRVEIAETSPPNGIGHSPTLYDILPTSNGKLILFYQSYSSNYQDFGLREINANGSLPTGSDVVWTETDQLDESAFRVGIQPDNRILVGGAVANHDAGSSTYDMLLARFDPSGYTNEEFGNQGYIRKDISGDNDKLNDFILLPNGKILGVGEANSFNVFLARFNPDGSSDVSFGNSGQRIFQDIINNNDIKMSGLMPDNRFVVKGDAVGGKSFLIRFKENGDVDSTFNGGQKVKVPFMPGDTNLWVQDLVVLPDHRILVCGANSGSNKNLVVSRLLPAANATAWYHDMDMDNYGNSNDAVYSVDQPSGYIAIGGDCNDLIASINPSVPELCNGTDDNCNGLLDEIPTIVCVESSDLSLDIAGTVTLNPESFWISNSMLPCSEDIVSLSLDTMSFDCSDIGEHTLTLTATSGQGGTSTCLVNVQILDKIAPLVECIPELSITIDDTGLYTLAANQLDAGSSDNCGIVATTINPPQFSTNDIGLQTVYYTVTDASGNASSCLSVVTVSGISTTKDIDDLQAVLLTPNPVKSQISLHIPAHWKSETINLQLLDAQGRVLWQNKGFVATIHVTQWPVGHYFLRVEKDGQSRVLGFEKE